MIEIKIGEVTYNIKTSWNEVKFCEYVELLKLKDKDFIEKMAVYTGIPKAILGGMKLGQFFVLMDLVAFMDEPDLINAFAIGYESKESVGEQPYWKVEKAKQLLTDNDIPLTAAAEIIKLYTGNEDGEGGEDINELPVIDAIGKAAFFLTSCKSSLSVSKG